MAETDVKVDTTETTEAETQQGNETVEQTEAQSAESAKIARLEAEIAKLNNKNNALAKENAEQKKVIRASKSAEEQRAEEEKEQREATQQELETLRRQFTVANISKSVMGLVGDEATANTIAEALYGAADVDAALDAFNKAWTAREKQLKLQYGKIPAPEAGDGGPQVSAEAFANMGYMERLELKRKSPDTFRKLTMAK